MFSCLLVLINVLFNKEKQALEIPHLTLYIILVINPIVSKLIVYVTEPLVDSEHYQPVLQYA